MLSVEEQQTLQEWYARFRTPLPLDAVKPVAVTGLTDIDVMFVIHRLNMVFGPIGYGWGIKGESAWVEDYQVTKDGQPKPGAIFQGHLWYRLPNGEVADPIIMTGGVVANMPYDMGNALKGAVSNALTKAASFLGIGIEVFSGKLKVVKGHDKAEIEYDMLPKREMDNFTAYLAEHNLVDLLDDIKPLSLLTAYEVELISRIVERLTAQEEEEAAE